MAPQRARALRAHHIHERRSIRRVQTLLRRALIRRMPDVKDAGCSLLAGPFVSVFIIRTFVAVKPVKCGFTWPTRSWRLLEPFENRT